MGVILFIIAFILGVILYPIGFIYSIIKILYIYISTLGKTFAVGIDLYGNVICADLFNDILITKSSTYKFGNPNETVSRVLGMNKKSNNLTKLGIQVARFLNWLDPNHVENASK